MEGRAAPLVLSCRPSAVLKLPSDFNSRHKTLHDFGENFMKIRPKLKKKLSMFKSQFYVWSVFEVFIVE